MVFIVMSWSNVTHRYLTDALGSISMILQDITIFDTFRGLRTEPNRILCLSQMFLDSLFDWTLIVIY